jgi:2-C-methyl-D-erythritol 4-phosphate cytidylyltransferase
VTAQQDVRGDVAVLVAAAGLGTRLGGGTPKALRLLAGESLLSHAIRRILAAPSVGTVIVAGPPELGPLPGPVVVVPGGATRQASVAAALAATPPEYEVILVHDAARALAPTSLVESVAAAVRAGWDAVIPVLPVVDTVKEVAASGTVVGTVDRSALRIVQTPQGFRRAILAAAHAAAGDGHTDDAGMVEKLGIPVHTVPGHEAAFKITRPLDLVLAEALLAAGTLGS